jgi:hypothetical protein
MKIDCGCSKALGGMRGVGAAPVSASGVVFNPGDPNYAMLMQLRPKYLAMGGNIAAVLAMQQADDAKAAATMTQPFPINPPVSTAQTCTTPACIAATSQLNQTLATGGNVVGGGNPGAVSTSDIMLGTFDATTFLSQYGIWLAVGAAALFLLNKR